MKRLRPKDLSAVTVALLKKQGERCPICESPLTTRTLKRPALDHDHDTGYIRDVLCMNCNGIEGKIKNLVRRLGKNVLPEVAVNNILEYWRRHQTPQHGGWLHPTHKTAEEKRELRNKKARERRKQK